MKQVGGEALGEATPTFMECSVQEGVVKEQTPAFCPALGLAPHHQLAAVGSLQTWGENTGLRVAARRGSWAALANAQKLRSSPHYPGVHDP